MNFHPRNCPESCPRDGGGRWLAALLVACLLPAVGAAASDDVLDTISIPLVDLQDREQHHVVVDREPQQYLGHPTTVVLDDGKTLLTVYPKGHGSGAIVKKRSTDGGKTWGERESTPENWSTSMETPTLFRVDDEEGNIERLLMFSGSQTRFGDQPVRLAVGDPTGKDWTALEPIPPRRGVVAMASMIDLPSGELIAYYHSSGLMATHSEDRGESWSEPWPALEGDAYPEEVRLCEPGVVVSPDGDRYALLLRENARNRNSFIIFSDDGREWSEPRELPLALTGDRHTARYAPDGRLFISFRGKAPNSKSSRPFEGDWVGWVGTWDDLVEGNEGQYFIRLRDNTRGADCAYPGVEVIDDGTIVTTTYGHWDKGETAYIRCVRFRMEDLDRYAEQP